MCDMDYSQIARQISQTFEKNFSFLDPPHQAHFATRMWRITGHKKYLPPIAADFKTQILDLSDPVAAGMKILKSKKFVSERGKKKEDWYGQKPGLLFAIELVGYLFRLKSYGLEEKLKKINLSGRAYVVHQNVKNFLFNPEQMRLDPSETVNSIAYLKFLKIADYEAEFRKIFLDFWFKQTTEEDWLFINKIYGLTHLLIADSWFYQRFIDFPKFAKILSYFETDIDHIRERVNADILAEIGIGFRLTGTQSPALEKICRSLATSYEAKLGYIPREERGLQAAEHRNIAAILVLADYDKLYPGPNLAKYF